MRIVRLANFVTPSSGGLRTSLRELGAGYLAAGHEPVLIIPGDRDSDEHTSQGRVITLRGPRVPFLGGYRVLLSRRTVAAQLAAVRPDVLEVSDRTTLRWTGRWAAERGIPAVMISHESLTALAPRAADVLNRRTARSYDQVICTTAWAAAEFVRIGAGNVVRAPLGVDLDTFRPRPRSWPAAAEGSTAATDGGPAATDDRPAAPDGLPAPAGPIPCLTLVHCGRLSTEKKPGRSLSTLATLRAQGLPVRLVMAGDGPLRGRLERRAAKLRLPVEFPGFVSGRTALAELLASADVVIAPGPAETFGLAALEALACGTPVVVSAESALPEVVGAAGAAVAGEDLAEGVRAVLAQPEAARRKAARDRAELFGWPAAVDAFLAIHQAATSERTSA